MSPLVSCSEKLKKSGTVKSRNKKMKFPLERIPHFFKIFIPHRSSEKLHLPPAFIKHFNGVVPRRTILKSRTGRFWHVELEQVGNDLFFQGGWKGFVKDHYLEMGDFLVFRYDGNTVFNVIIFSRTGCEKEETFAYRNSDNKTLYVKKEEQPEARGTLNRRAKRNYFEGSPKKIGKAKYGSARLKRNAAVKVAEDTSFETACFVLPKNPHFVASLKMRRPYHLPIPKKLVTENHLKMEPLMILRDPNGESWPVKIHFWKDGRVAISSGWVDVYRGNALGKDDKCIFEFIQGSGGKHIQMHILRAGAGNSTDTQVTQE